MAGFQDIIGHEQIISHLKNAIAMDTVSHAYILDGPDRSGKRMLAEAFAMTLQCEGIQHTVGAESEDEPMQQSLFGAAEPANWQSAFTEEALERCQNLEPCMECRSCKQALGMNQPDIIHVTHEKPNTISVQEIRVQLNQDIQIKPYSSKYKIYIVDEAEKMNVQAQNALLKTIEEPPAYAVILLLTTNANAFLPTILSRCVKLELKAVPDQKIRRYLMISCGVPDYQADICTAFAQGNVGRAMMLAASENFQKRKDFTVRLLGRLEKLPVYELAGELKPLADAKDEIQDFFDLILLWFRDVLLYKATGRESMLIYREDTFEIKHQAERCSYMGLNEILQAVDIAGKRIRANVNFELTVELLMMTIKERLS